MEFRKARFQSLDHCEQFVASANVHSAARWTQYPWFQKSPEHGFESVAAEIDFPDPTMEHTERWVLFQSGQFVHNIALDRVLPLGKRTHVLEILEVLTALYEFTARMADQKILTGDIGILPNSSAMQGDNSPGARNSTSTGGRKKTLSASTTSTLRRSSGTAGARSRSKQRSASTRSSAGTIPQGKNSQPHNGNASARSSNVPESPLTETCPRS